MQSIYLQIKVHYLFISTIENKIPWNLFSIKFEIKMPNLWMSFNKVERILLDNARTYKIPISMGFIAFLHFLHYTNKKHHCWIKLPSQLFSELVTS